MKAHFVADFYQIVLIEAFFKIIKLSEATGPWSGPFLECQKAKSMGYLAIINYY